jgi:hypothetical protein
LVTTILLFAFNYFYSDLAPLLSAWLASYFPAFIANHFLAWLASYFLIGTIVLMANIVFLTKIFGPLKSIERTLLLFIFNLVQLILTFAIWYRSVLGLQAREALFKAMLVFGTIGYPEGAEVVVGVQIAADFFLLAIFLVFVLNFRPQGQRRRG